MLRELMEYEELARQHHARKFAAIAKLSCDDNRVLMEIDRRYSRCVMDSKCLCEECRAISFINDLRRVTCQ